MGGINIMVTGEYIMELYKWYTAEELTVNRGYQRKLVWTLKEKQEFIKTILDGYPVPLFLIVNSSIVDNTGDVKKTKEILDGLQRIEAIISFILNRFPVEWNGQLCYFNLETCPGNKILIREKKLNQMNPVLNFDVSEGFLLYQLPISVIDSEKTIIDDVFRRINSTGRKLSAQDLRQAGVTSRFSDLVRVTATHLRGDATEDIIKLQDMALCSLNNDGLDYGLNINEVFWVKQGIISESSLRRSKDEEIIAILYACILTEYKIGTYTAILDSLYESSSSNYLQINSILTTDKQAELLKLFQLIILELEKAFVVSDNTFGALLFNNSNSYNKDLVFIVVFLAIAQLHNENYIVTDHKRLAVGLKHLASNELKELTCRRECVWNVQIRNGLITRIKNILINYMDFREVDPKWNASFVEALKRFTVEQQMCDFKIGFHDLRTGAENNELIRKCVKTLIAMANTKPNKDGVIVIGISDKATDAIAYDRFYGTSSPKYNDYYVTGIANEATRFYGSIDNFIKHLQTVIQQDTEVNDEVKYDILSSIDILRYEKQTLMVMRLSTDKPLFYGETLYIRYNSDNTRIKQGSQAYYNVLSKFGIGRNQGNNHNQTINSFN